MESNSRRIQKKNMQINYIYWIRWIGVQRTLAKFTKQQKETSRLARMWVEHLNSQSGCGSFVLVVVYDWM